MSLEGSRRQEEKISRGVFGMLLLLFYRLIFDFGEFDEDDEIGDRI